jgi:hypothetical protein
VIEAASAFAYLISLLVRFIFILGGVKSVVFATGGFICLILAIFLI